MDAFTIMVVTLTMVLVIAFARKIEKPILAGVLIVLNLMLLIYHTYLLNTIPSVLEEAVSQVYLCIAMDFLWLLVSFLGYLWIDDIAATKFHRKSYDSSMNWFWDKL